MVAWNAPRTVAEPVTLNPALPEMVNDPLITAFPLNGNAVAVTPVNPVPSPLNDPVNEPVNGRVNELNCRELETVPAGTVAVAFNA